MNLDGQMNVKLTGNSLGVAGPCTMSQAYCKNGAIVSLSRANRFATMNNKGPIIGLNLGDFVKLVCRQFNPDTNRMLVRAASKLATILLRCAFKSPRTLSGHL